MEFISVEEEMMPYFWLKPPSLQSQNLFFYILVLYIYHVLFNFYFISMAFWFSSKFICDGRQETWLEVEIWLLSIICSCTKVLNYVILENLHFY